MKIRFTVEAELDPGFLLNGAAAAPAGQVLARAARLVEDVEHALSDAVSWKHGVIHGTVKVRQMNDAQ